MHIPAADGRHRINLNEQSLIPTADDRLGHGLSCERHASADVVEKVAARLFQFARRKIDLSDRPTNRSRTRSRVRRPPKTSVHTRRATFSTTSAINGRWPPQSLTLERPVCAREQTNQTLPLAHHISTVQSISALGVDSHREADLGAPQCRCNHTWFRQEA